MYILVRHKSTTKINTIWLIREPSIDTERWVHESSHAVLRDIRKLLKIRVVELDQIPVLIDARWSHGLGEDGRATGDCI